MNTNNKCYLIAITINGEHYIQLTDNNSLDAYEDKEKAIGVFDNFRKKATSNDYETFISGSMGIIGIRPNIIEVDRDNPEMLREYILDDKVYNLKGSVIGAFVNMRGMKVKVDILKLSVCDICNDIINEAYGIKS